MGGKHDGDCFGYLSSSLDLGRRRREDNAHIHADQIGRELRELFDLLCPAEFYIDVLALT